MKREKKTLEQMEYKKNYYQENKEKIKAQKKLWDEQNGERVMSLRSELVQCDCGCFIQRKTKGSIRHTQTQRHKDGMKTFAPNIV